MFRKINFDTYRVLWLFEIAVTGKLLGKKGTCAWTMIYITYAPKHGFHRQLFRFGYDPEYYAHKSPSICLAFNGGRGFKIHLPIIKWDFAYKFKFLMPIYKIQQRIVTWSDGRFYGSLK